VGSPAVQISTVTMVKESLNQPTIPTTTILALLDHVNDDTFEGGAAGKVIYRGARTQRVWTTGGILNWSIAHSFQYRSIEWNKFLRPTASSFSWDTIVYKDGSPLSPSGDFTALFPTNPSLGL
jgi:hypothetical protein